MVIIISNQKGGIQKSTLTTLFSSTIHYGFRRSHVAAIDADMQQDIAKDREEDMRRMEKDQQLYDKVMAYLNVSGKEYIYPIESASLSRGEVVPKIAELELTYDIIFVDVPGSLEIKGMGQTLASADYIIVPFHPDERTVRSTKEHLGKLKTLMTIKGCKIKEVCIVFTRYVTDKRLAKYKLFEYYRRYFEAQGYKVFDNALRDTSTFENFTTDTDLLEVLQTKGNHKSANTSINIDPIAPVDATISEEEHFLELMKNDISGENVRWTEGMPVLAESEEHPSAASAPEDIQEIKKSMVSTILPFPADKKYEEYSPYLLVEEVIKYLKFKNKIYELQG